MTCQDRLPDGQAWPDAQGGSLDWRRHLAWNPDGSGTGRSEVSDMMGELMRVSQNNPALVDFSGLSAQSVEPSMLCSALRATFSVREAIASWEDGLLVCIDALALRGDDARSICRGLLNAERRSRG